MNSIRAECCKKARFTRKMKRQQVKLKLNKARLVKTVNRLKSNSNSDPLLIEVYEDVLSCMWPKRTPPTKKTNTSQPVSTPFAQGILCFNVL